MREACKDPWRIRHILDAIKRIERYISGKSYDDFLQDDMVYYAVVKNVEIIGEAANMLTKDFRELHDNIPWRAICGMRNYIVHEYFSVDSIVVWEVITKDLGELKNKLELLIDE